MFCPGGDSLWDSPWRLRDFPEQQLGGNAKHCLFGLLGRFLPQLRLHRPQLLVPDLGSSAGFLYFCQFQALVNFRLFRGLGNLSQFHIVSHWKLTGGGS